MKKFVLSILVFCIFFSVNLFAATVKIKIDPATGKPKIISDVKIVSTYETPTGWTVVNLATGESFSYFVDPEGNIAINVISGEINVVAQNTRARIEAGKAAAFKITKKGEVQVTATKGSVEVSSQGRTIRLTSGQQTRIAIERPPSPPTTAKFSAPPVFTPPPPPPPPPPPTPPEFQVNVTQKSIQEEVAKELTKDVVLEEVHFHGLPPASPAE